MSAFKSQKKNKRLLFLMLIINIIILSFLLLHFPLQTTKWNGNYEKTRESEVLFPAWWDYYIIVVCDGSWCDAIWCVMARFVTVTSQSTKLSLFRLASLLKFQFSAEIQACVACTIWKKGIWCEIQSKSKLFEQRERCVIRFHQTATK